MPWFYISLLLRFAFAGMWLVSGASKVLAIDVFTQTVQDYQFPFFSEPELAMWIGYGLPWLELGIGVLLLVGFLKRSCYGVSLGLFWVFILAVSHAMWQGIEIPCGCFGAISTPISGWHLLGLAVAALLSIFQLVLDEKKLKDVWIEQGCQ